jgi:hypothetical protein
MYCRCIRSRSPGFFTTELIAGSALLALITALGVKTYLEYRGVRDDCLRRQEALWAASGQFQRIVAGAPLDSRPPEMVISDRITLRATSEPGQGQWTGFVRVTVEAGTTGRGGRQIRERVSGYLQPGGES